MWINTSGNHYLNGNQVWWMTMEPPRRITRLMGYRDGKLTEIGIVESKYYEKACALAETLLKLTEPRAGLEKIEFVNLECFSKVELIPGLGDTSESAMLTAPDGGTLRIDDSEQIRIIKAHLTHGGRKK